MIILGLDYGLKRIGVAMSFGSLAEPFVVIQNNNAVLEELKKIIKKENVEKIVVGISEGEMASKTREFIKELKKETDLSVEEFDETLSTMDAQTMAIESGMKRKKRKEMIDAMAAALVLQNYIDFN